MQSPLRRETKWRLFHLTKKVEFDNGNLVSPQSEQRLYQLKEFAKLNVSSYLPHATELCFQCTSEASKSFTEFERRILYELQYPYSFTHTKYKNKELSYN